MQRLSVRDINCGDVFESNKCGKYKVVRVESSAKVYIEFLETGFKRYVSVGSMTSGSIRDGFVRTVCGVGYLGYAKSTDDLNLYSVWKSMIERCYRKTHIHYKNYGGKGVSVCDRWHSFENFLTDAKELEGYKEKSNSNYKYELDKDHKCLNGDKIYSPTTCMWLRADLNNANRTNNAHILASHPIYGDIEFRNIRRWCRHTGHIVQRITHILKYGGTHYGWTFKRIEH